MLDEHGIYHDKTKRPDEDYGSGDPKVPYGIGGAVAAVLIIAMHTVGHKMSIGTTLAFILDMIWLAVGVGIALVWTIIIWIPMERKHKWWKMLGTITLGITYFVVSGVLMAVLPRMN